MKSLKKQGNAGAAAPGTPAGGAATTVVNIKLEACDVYIGRPMPAWNKHIKARCPNTRTPVDDQGVPFANPFRVVDYGRPDALNLYEDLMRVRLGLKAARLCDQRYRDGLDVFDRHWTATDWRRELMRLSGKRLGCWCAPDRCHGDVLVELIAEIERLGGGAGGGSPGSASPSSSRGGA